MTHRTQRLILAFLGSCVVDKLDVSIRTQLYIDILAPLNVSEAAVRSTLVRMIERGFLTTKKVGRDRNFSLTEEGRNILREAGVRVRAEDPFSAAGKGWTLLSYSVPEDRRALRHQLRARLSWAGFGLLHNGLWIAPGEANLNEIFRTLRERQEITVYAFYSTPIEQWWTNLDFVREAWDLSQIAEAHNAFIDSWDNKFPSKNENPLTRFTALIADWLQLLRVDPRLPTDYLPPDWPAQKSIEVFRKAHANLEGKALHALASTLRLDKTLTSKEDHLICNFLISAGFWNQVSDD